MSDAIAPSALFQAIDRMSSREKRLVGLTAVVAIFVLFGGTYWAVDSHLETRAKRVQNLQASLLQIRALEGQYRAAESRESQSTRRLKSNNVSLFSVLQKSAGQLGLVLNDLNERQLPFKDGELIQVSVDVNLKQVSIDKLNSFLEKIEGRSSGGVIKITKLKVKTRHDNEELLDVSMTVATWKTS